MNTEFAQAVCAGGFAEPAAGIHMSFRRYNAWQVHRKCGVRFIGAGTARSGKLML